MEKLHQTISTNEDMRRVVCLLILLLLMFSGCAQEQEDSQISVGSFSYAEERAYYMRNYVRYPDMSGVQLSDFVNVEMTELQSPADAVELAKKECTIQYDTIDVDYDQELNVYSILFYTDGWLGGCQTVYIDENGVTLLIVYGE